MDILKVINKEGNKFVNFNFFDDTNTVKAKAIEVSETFDGALLIMEEYERRKQSTYNKAYLEYLKKAREDKSLQVVQHLNKMGKSITISIFDEPDEIIEKYSEYYGKELSREMKISVLKHFNRIVRLNVIDSMVNPKGKIK